MPPSPAATPESLLPRTDSLNPSRTCAGLTTSGRPCRRAIASTLSSTGSNTPTRSSFCWQHVNQAPASPPSVPTSAHTMSEKVDLKPRTSLDTLAERMGVMSVTSGSTRPPKRPDPRPSRPHQNQNQKPSIWSSLCCFVGSAGRSNEEDYYEIIRHKKRHPRPTQTIQTQPQSGTSSTRPTAHRPTNSIIPHSLDANTHMLLAAEMAKPISQSDTDGYIYIFWLTPTTSSPPDESETETLLAGSTNTETRSLLPQRTELSNERADQLLARHSTVRAQSPSARERGSIGLPSRSQKKTVLLKIGRARNVHRRMEQWRQQCGYDVSLLRFYPYIPREKWGENSRAWGRTVPIVHRVERLIHIELEGKRAKTGECENCGRSHREWFEVEASRRGIREVDEIVRRWCDWAERGFANSTPHGRGMTTEGLGL